MLGKHQQNTATITRRRQQTTPLGMDAEMRTNLQFLAKHEGLNMKTTAKLLFKQARAGLDRKTKEIDA